MPDPQNLTRSNWARAVTTVMTTVYSCITAAWSQACCLLNPILIISSEAEQGNCEMQGEIGENRRQVDPSVVPRLRKI